MHVMVTGSAGKIGREAVRALKVAGHKVTGIDLKGGIVDGVRTVKVDCADFGEVMGAFSGVDTISKPDAVVHLAGIPMPGLASDAAASDLCADIRLLVHLYRLERFHSNGALVFDGEVVFHGATVDGDFAGAAGRQAHAGNRSLAAACS